MTHEERKAANREKTRRYRQANPHKVAEQRRKKCLQSRRRKYWLAKIKTSAGCSECGFNKHHSALDFDHINVTEKCFHIAQSLSGRSLKMLFAEIRKCRILCANCHREHTFNQSQERLKYAGS